MSVSSVEFVKKFSPKKTAAIYLVFGNESFLRQESIQFIRKQLGEENVFFREYDPEESEIAVANIIMDLSSDALFDDLNLIIVKSADPLVQQLLSPLEKYLKSPNSNSILILELAKADGRSKIVKLADKYGVAIKCQQLYDRPKPWLNLPPWESELVHWLVKEWKLSTTKKLPLALLIICHNTSEATCRYSIRI